MKILQAFDFLSLPHGGGTVDIVYRLSKALSARGHEVTICTGDHELDCKYLSGLGDVGVKMYRSYFNKHGIYLMPGLTKLDVRNYDVIHLHCFRSIQNIVLAKRAVANGVPYIVDAHGSTVPRNGKKTVLLNTYDLLAGKWLIDHAKFVIAETEVGIIEWERLGAYESEIRLQHPLLDTSEFAVLPEKGSFRKKFHLGSEFVVLFLGRIHHAKGIDTLVDAVRILRARNVDVSLVLAGQDDGFKAVMLDYLAGMSYNEPIKVLFTGFLSGVDKLSALVDADVLVQPSRNEAGARPSLEAVMCETPVIVSQNTGAGKEIAKFDGGLLFKSGDASELADAIQSIINHPKEARARTEKAKMYIEENLSLDKGITGYEKLYQEAVS